MLRYVVYTRVSTEGQGKSGLGLEPQERDIGIFLDRFSAVPYEIIGRFQDLGSGVNNGRPGNEALIMKAKLPRGEFKPWLQTQCEVVETTADVYMRVARLYGDNDAMLDNVQATGLLVLSKTKTPAVVRDAVEAIVAKGGYVTREKIEDLIAEHHQPRKAAA
ncbi:recombinase family protein [Ensifer aridi]|uniref:recombinase family protein n=1 Tax=Ensifer aridi TaxID=1708715 RepID=UPI00111C4D37|nr:recombinase family protein [Ensifer aridi]